MPLGLASGDVYRAGTCPPFVKLLLCSKSYAFKFAEITSFHWVNALNINDFCFSETFLAQVARLLTRDQGGVLANFARGLAELPDRGGLRY